MIPTAALIDLFGTLVAPFRRSEHSEALRRCASILKLEFEDVHSLWISSFPDRIRGRFACIADNFTWISDALDRPPDRIALADAVQVYSGFTLESLRPLPGAMEGIEWLAARGVKLGLVTNCAPDIAELWHSSSFSPYFDYCAFSCRIGSCKPDSLIYETALREMSAAPGETVYIGDGSDEELSGAAACGLTPILLRADLANTYDSVRSDVLSWSGPAIGSIMGVTTLADIQFPSLK